MRKLYIALALLAVTGCQRSDPETKQRMIGLEARVADLEIRLANDEKRLAAQSFADTQKRYELFGLPGTRRLYDDLPTCQTAMKTVIQSMDDRDREQQANSVPGIRFGPSIKPALSCIPA